jgi:TatD DNase family protein
MYIDTHAHIYLESFLEDTDSIVQRAVNNGIGGIYMPNIDVSSVGSMVALEDTYPEYCHSMIGLHPCSVKADFNIQLEKLEHWLSQRKFSGIGETGTDLYWDKTFHEQQVEALEIQINWAKRYNLPIILHSRNSLDLSIQIIEKNHQEGLSGIFHCFTGSLDQARCITEMGFYLGIGGVITFKKSNLGDILQYITLENIVLETDSPYLAPVPHRGKRNEPSYIPHIAGRLAEIYDVSVKEIAKITTTNARRIFKAT